jgi:hypothetical protein
VAGSILPRYTIRILFAGAGWLLASSGRDMNKHTRQSDDTSRHSLTHSLTPFFPPFFISCRFYYYYYYYYRFGHPLVVGGAIRRIGNATRALRLASWPLPPRPFFKSRPAKNDVRYHRCGTFRPSIGASMPWKMTRVWPSKFFKEKKT